MTRDLAWTPPTRRWKEVFPYTEYEGIKIHDWDKWEDPFRLTMDAYWKYQAEKERKLYAIIDAFAQNNGHLASPTRATSTRSSCSSPASRRWSTWRTAASPTSAASSPARARAWPA
jgi:hypothetical protein